MKKLFPRKLILTVFFIPLVLVLTLFPSGVFAQAETQGVTITPPRFELLANPGDMVTESVRLRNESAFPITYQIVAEDFASSGEEGAVVLEEESTNQSYSLAAWITPEIREITLQPQQETTLSFRIAVPRDAEPGGHYASVLFSTGSEDIEGGAAVTQRIGTLVLLRVTGNVEESATIETFEAPNYSQKGPVTFTLRLSNQGNVHIAPKGTIVITNFLNQKVDELPLSGNNVLPGSIRKMEVVWDRPGIFGVYTATLVATYGQQNLPLAAASRFTVISPTTAVFLVVAGLALLFFLFSLVSGRKRLKKALKALSSD